MSTDYNAVCMTCRKHIHLGQRMGLGWSFGYGTGDDKTIKLQGEWLMFHLHTQWDGVEIKRPCDVRVMVADSVPEDFEREELGP